MALPASGIITMAQVATELGITSTGINLNQANVRTLAQKPSGVISMSDLRGKQAAVAFSYTTVRNTAIGLSGLQVTRDETFNFTVVGGSVASAAISSLVGDSSNITDFVLTLTGNSLKVICTSRGGSGICTIYILVTFNDGSKTTIQTTTSGWSRTT